MDGGFWQMRECSQTQMDVNKELVLSGDCDPRLEQWQSE
jgi:hypothetical protein